MEHYIEADKLIAEIERWRDKAKEKYNESTYSMGRCDALAEFCNHIVSLLEEQPDFPTTDEEIEMLLATNPKIEVPEKYKNPDWLFKKQEQPEVDLEKEIIRYQREDMDRDTTVRDVARHFFELGLNARKGE